MLARRRLVAIAAVGEETSATDEALLLVLLVLWSASLTLRLHRERTVIGGDPLRARRRLSLALLPPPVVSAAERLPERAPGVAVAPAAAAVAVILLLAPERRSKGVVGCGLSDSCR